MFTPADVVLHQFSAITATLFAHGMPGPKTYITSHSRKLSRVGHPNTQGPWSLHIVYEHHQTGCRSRAFAVQPEKLPSWLTLSEADMAFLHVPVTLRNIALWPGIQRRDDEMALTAQPKRRTKKTVERTDKHANMIELASTVVPRMQLTPYLKNLIRVSKIFWPDMFAQDSGSRAVGTEQDASTVGTEQDASTTHSYSNEGLRRPDTLPLDEESRLLRAAEFARALMIASPQILFMSEGTLKVGT